MIQDIESRWTREARQSQPQVHIVGGFSKHQDKGAVRSWDLRLIDVDGRCRRIRCLLN